MAANEPTIEAIPVIPPPSQQLDPRARQLWIVEEAISVTFGLVAIGAGAWALIRFTPLTTLWIVLAAIALGLALVGGALTTVLWRYTFWRYEIHADEVDLQHGWLVRRRQMVPMSRIQHVDSRRGPLQRRFGLASVVFYTAAGPMEIPALSQDVADRVRTRIAELAKVHDDL